MAMKIREMLAMKRRWTADWLSAIICDGCGSIALLVIVMSKMTGDVPSELYTANLHHTAPGCRISRCPRCGFAAKR